MGALIIGGLTLRDALLLAAIGRHSGFVVSLGVEQDDLGDGGVLRGRSTEVAGLAIDMGRLIVFLDTGERCPITAMLDDKGDETSDPDEAARLVFEIKSVGKWGACVR